jgi:pyrimidine-nucleoside phosphorylase
MDTEEKAANLAEAMVAVGHKLNRPVTAVVTDMEQPLGMAVGHTLEVIEAIETLRGKGPADLNELCLELGSLALITAGKCKNHDQAKALLQETIDSGKALQWFQKLVKAQGGNPDVTEDYTLMPAAKFKRDFHAPHSKSDMWVEHLDGRKVADACKLMGAGREKKGDEINLAVGIVLRAKVGSKIESGGVVAEIYADTEEQFHKAAQKLEEAFTYADWQVQVPSVIKATVS